MFLIIEIFFIAFLSLILFMIYRHEGEHSRRSALLADMEEFWDGKERRQHYRFAKALPVSYSIEKKPHLKVECKTIDISEGGLQLRLSEKLSKGMIADMLIELPETKHRAELEGEVVWTDESGEVESDGKVFFRCGIRFLALKEPGDQSLARYIRSLASGNNTG